MLMLCVGGLWAVGRHDSAEIGIAVVAVLVIIGRGERCKKHPLQPRNNGDGRSQW